MMMPVLSPRVKSLLMFDVGVDVDVDVEVYVTVWVNIDVLMDENREIDFKSLLFLSLLI